MVSMFELGSFCAIKMRSPRMPTSPQTALSQVHDPDGSGFRCVDQQRIYQRLQNGTGPQPSCADDLFLVVSCWYGFSFATKECN